jgi:hypothetical protein
MKKYKILVIFSLLIVGTFTHANVYGEFDTKARACPDDAMVCTDGTTISRTGPNCEFVCPGQKPIPFKKINRQEDKTKNFPQVDISIEGEGDSDRGQAIIKKIQIQRQEFESQMQIRKEEMKKQRVEEKNKFRLDLQKIKDQRKQYATEKIIETIEVLNKRLTNNLSEKINQIESVLGSIESRLNKAQDKNLETKAVEDQILKAKESISLVRDEILTQSNKSYLISITENETLLREEMKELRNRFNEDIKNLREKVKMVHFEVKEVAIILAKIPKINEVEIVENENN